MKNKRGFTLIELLVVIAIIAMLMAILVPALRFAKRQAAGAVCLSNINGLSRAWHTYAMSNDDKLVNGHAPRSANYNNLSYWLSRGYVDNAWWVNPPHDENGNYTGEPLCTLEDEDRGIRSGALFPYADNSNVYHCPGSRQYLSKDPVRRGGKRSYSITGMMNGETNGNNRDNQPFGGWRMATKITDIKAPGNKCVFVEDTDPRGWNMGSWVMWNSSNWTDALAIFHINRGSLGFADGHAEMHHWLDESTVYNAEHLLEGLRKNIDWANGEGTDFEYMKRVYSPY